MVVLDNGSIVYFIPVGALTAKVYNFSTRPWELQVKKTVDYFSFFAYPVTVYLKNSSVVRVTSFRARYWISDSTRFFFQNYSVSMSQVNNLVFCNKIYSISWAELAFLVIKEVVGNKFFRRKPIRFYRVKQSITNFCVVGKYSDAKDTHIILSRLFSIANSVVMFPHVNGFFSEFSTSVTRQTYTAPSLSTGNFSFDDIHSITACFIFWSNLRYESPILNFKVRQLFFEDCGFKVFFFGEFNSLYLFNYPVVYLGGLPSFFKLVSGRVKGLSSLFFSCEVFSIFGSAFYEHYTEFSPSIFKLLVSLQNSITLQSDFSQNSVLWHTGGSVLRHKSFNIPFSNFRGFYNKFNLITINTNYKVFVSTKSLTRVSDDIYHFFVFKFFKFGQDFVNPRNSSEPAWVCNVNSSSFINYSNYYLNNFNRISYLPFISRDIAGSVPRSVMHIFNYIFFFSLEKYSRYTSNYLTLSSRFFLRPVLNFRSLVYGSSEILSYFLNERKLHQFVYSYFFRTLFDYFRNVELKFMDDAELFVWFHVFDVFYENAVIFVTWFRQTRSYITKKCLFFTGGRYAVRKIRSRYSRRVFNVFKFQAVSRHFVFLYFRKNCIFLSTYTSMFKFTYSFVFKLYSFNDNFILLSHLTCPTAHFFSFWFARPYLRGFVRILVCE